MSERQNNRDSAPTASSPPRGCRASNTGSGRGVVGNFGALLTIVSCAHRSLNRLFDLDRAT
jgi:hypothetical protein